MKKHIVIIGGGFAGINCIKKIKNEDYQITLVDKNNYNFFTPLLYQIGTAFLEPASICYPFRKILKNRYNIRFWMGEVYEIKQDKKEIHLNNGKLHYDHLIIATGTVSNFFGNDNIKKYSIPMKSLSEAINMRNVLLGRIEDASISNDINEKEKLLTVVVAGGGPTGVEVSGLLAEMRTKIFPNEYKNLKNFKQLQKIILVDGSNALLNNMSESSQKYTYDSLQKLQVDIRLNVLVKDYDGETISFSDGSKIESKNLIWAAGVTGHKFRGLEDFYGPGNRLLVDEFNRVKNCENIFAIGDISLNLDDPNFPKGHPQVAQVAIQQGRNLANNIDNSAMQKEWTKFEYIDKGSMAIIGRNKAVAEFGKTTIKGFTAWFLWLFVHLFSILNYRNRIRTMYNWASAFFTNDVSLRLIVRPSKKD